MKNAKKVKIHGTCYKVTDNGEITYDSFTAKYSVWNEGYSEAIYTTGCEEAAFDYLKQYCIETLGVDWYVK